MANVKNDWIGYLDRSYLQIKQSVLARVKNSNPELTDFSESNPFVILIGIFAAIAEMLGYYIDNIAEEGFLAVAQRRTSVIKHTRALDYRIKASSPEQVDLTITWNEPVPNDFTISAGFFINSTDGIGFYSLTDVAVLAGALTSVVPVAQIALVNAAAFGLTDGTKNQKVNLGASYVQGSLQLTIDGFAYTEVNTFAYLINVDKSFIVDIDGDGNAYAILGDGIKGILPGVGLVIGVVYNNTLGADGKVGAGGFDKNTIIFNNVLPATLLVDTVNTILSSSGGSTYEAIEDIRNNSVRSIRTLDRAVTPQDFIDIASGVAGVIRADINFNCGKNINVYIVPVGGGIASGGLIAAAQAVLDGKKMVTTFPIVKPAGQTQLVIKTLVTVRKRKSITITKQEVVDALVAFGLPQNQSINGALRLSDLQALIDNLPSVDFMELTAVYTRPYARPINHLNSLVWVNDTRVASINTVAWKLEYDGAIIRVFRDGIYLNNVALDVAYVAADNIFTFTVSAGGYASGNSWEFKTYPFLKSIQLTDFTILGIDPADLSITVKPAIANPLY